jgi:enamine deaminase RidA (YjgF/YER057c/UK114 family)
VTGTVHPEPPHRRVDPKGLAKAIGYSHGVLAAPGRTLYLAGQVGWDANSRFPHPDDLVAQVDLALENLVAVLSAAGGVAEHLVSMRIYVRSADAWQANAKAIGEVWRRRLGRWYPAMTLVEVKRLYDAQALVEIEGIAVVPDTATR